VLSFVLASTSMLFWATTIYKMIKRNGTKRVWKNAINEKAI
jgi:hypothetical protein